MGLFVRLFSYKEGFCLVPMWANFEIFCLEESIFKIPPQVIPPGLGASASQIQNAASVLCGITAPRERDVNTQKRVSGGGCELRSLKCTVR